MRSRPSSTRQALAAAAACLVTACTAQPMTQPAPTPLDAVIAAALSDAARRSGLPRSDLRVASAEGVTWRDGSLGCPSPGMAYTQALVPGYRVRIVAGGTTYDYHAGRNGQPHWCPPGRAQDPLSEDARR